MIYTLTLNPAIDRTILVNEINKEDVTRVKQTLRDAAGKGVNVSKVIESLGYKSTCLGFLAGENGQFIKKQLGKLNILEQFIIVPGETRENIKVVEEYSNNVIELNEKGPEISLDSINQLLNQLRNLLKENDVLVISGSVPQGIDTGFYSQIIKEFKPLGITFIVDASGELFKNTIKALPQIIKPNRYELEQYLNKTISTDKEIVLEAKKLVASGINQVIISLGSEGSIYVDSLHSFKVNVPKLEVKGTVGAGDSFVGGLSVGLLRFDNPIDLMKYAASVASASCLTQGTSPGSIKDVENIIERISIEML